MSGKRGGWTGWFRRLRPIAPYLIGLAVIVGLVLAVSPGRFATAARRFDPAFAPIVAGLCLVYYLLQGLRWQPLLQAVGARLRLRDTMVLNLAGQSTGLLPGGELTRAVLVSEVAHIEVGAAVATITVQELLYTVLIIAAAVPGALHHSLAAIGVVVALAGVVGVTVILTVEAVFARLMTVVEKVPVLRSFGADAAALQRETVTLLRRRDTLWWSAVSALQAVVTITMFWVVVEAIDPGRLSWPDAAFVYAVAHIAGAVSLGPGGLGGFEAACIGMLVAVGIPFGVAVAASLLQRTADKGLGTVYGGAAYALARRRYDLKHARVVRHGQRRRRRRSSVDRAGAPGGGEA
ncbi:MAG TPA: lysylphosphatidylglycerol synthase transmembrane domain-containing protein [Candidatus Micrarchaeia archaeon]|nr:lysylphosphatidylglycerol synthase transmembrane domain-containing protein [Candidatus Micrarchaeia archaeon]